MKIKITENKYLNTLFLLMLVSASFHVLILFVSALMFQNLHFLNYFRILNIDYFLPDFINSFSGDIFSIFFAAFLYLAILKLNEDGR